MGNICGIISDQDIVRISLRLEQKKHEKLIQLAKKLPIFKDEHKYIYKERDMVFIFFQDQIEDFLKRDVKIFADFNEEASICNKNELNDETIQVKVNGQEINENEQMLNKIKQIMNLSSIKFIHLKLYNVLTIALHKFLDHQQGIYNFTNTKDIIWLNKIKGDFTKTVQPEVQYAKTNQIKYPYLLVNLRGGISFFRVDGQNSVHRIQGSIIGESMIEGLSGQLGDEEYRKKDINEKLAEAFTMGDNKKVDMVVEDIYGENTESLGLSKDLLASSLGKLAKSGQNLKYSNQDVMRSLVNSLCINLSQLSSLTAQISPGITQAIVVFWKLDNLFLNYFIQCFVNYYSKNQLEVFFVEKSHFLGSLAVYPEEENLQQQQKQ